MARLPSAEDLGRSPVPQGGRQIVDADTSAVPRSLAGLGATVGKIAEEQQREQDANAVFAARRQLDDWERATLFDPQKGAVNRLGQDSFNLPAELEQSFDQTAGKISESLTSERQRRAFQEMATSRRAQVLDWGAKHVTRERNVFEAGQVEAELKSMADRAAQFPDRAAGELALARDRITGFMRAKGRSTEEIAQAIKDQASKTHGQVIASLVNGGRAEEAQAYFKDNRGDMTADAALRAESSLKEITARTKAQGFADDVMTRGLTAENAIREARTKFSGVEEDAAVQELKTRFTESEVLKKRAQQEAGSEAWKILANGGGRKSIPPTLWASLGGEEQRQIVDWLDVRWRRAKSDNEDAKASDWGAYLALTDMARDNPEKFLDPQTLLKAEPYLSKAQMASLAGLRTTIGKQDAKASNVLTAMKNTEAMVLADMRAAGIDTTPKEGSKQAKELAAFRGALQMRIEAAQAEKGGALTPTEQKAIGMSLLKEGVEQGSGVFGMFQTKRRGFQMDPTKTYVETPYDDIPPDVRKQIEATLPREGGIYGNARKRMDEVERIYQRAKEAGEIR